MQTDHLAPAVRQRLKRLPAPHASHYGVVPLPPPETGIDLTTIGTRHTAAVTAMARADTYRHVANLHMLSRIFSRQEAVSSSSIEGTNSTLDELLLLDENEDAAAAASDAKQVRDYALILGQFIQRAAEQGPSIFTLGLVKELHGQIMKGDGRYRDEPGSLRSTVVWIGGGAIANSSWNAPPPEDVEACLEQTLSYMRDGIRQMTQDVITRMAVAHTHFEAVHPFRDGNGRAGRILLPLMMVAEGHVPLYLSPYIERYRGGYHGALKNAQRRLEWSAIVGFFCDAIVATVEHLDETIYDLEGLRQTWLRRRRFRQNSAAMRALAVLLQFPVLTVNRLAKELDVGIPRAAEAITQLADVGIIAERTGFKRNRLFCATEVLSIVNRPLAD